MNEFEICCEGRHLKVQHDYCDGLHSFTSRDLPGLCVVSDDFETAQSAVKSSARTLILYDRLPREMRDTVERLAANDAVYDHVVDVVGEKDKKLDHATHMEPYSDEEEDRRWAMVGRFVIGIMLGFCVGHTFFVLIK